MKNQFEKNTKINENDSRAVSGGNMGQEKQWHKNEEERRTREGDGSLTGMPWLGSEVSDNKNDDKEKIENIRTGIKEIYEREVRASNRNLDETAKENDVFIKKELEKRGIDQKEYEKRVAKRIWSNKTVVQKAKSILNGIRKGIIGK